MSFASLKMVLVLIFCCIRERPVRTKITKNKKCVTFAIYARKNMKIKTSKRRKKDFVMTFVK